MVTKITFRNRDEFLKHKNESFKLSSSNIGIILGFSEYISPWDYWRRYKNGEIQAETNAMKRGIIFEDAISKYFEEISTERVIKNTSVFYVLKRDNLPDYIEVSPDRELFKNGRKTRLFLEIKDTKRYINLENDEDIPKEWYAQIQMQMYVGGYEGCVLCVYNGEKELTYRYFNLDEDFAKNIIDEAINFCEKYIFGDEEPDIKTLEDSENKYPESEKESICEVENSFIDVIAAYNEKTAALKKLEKEISELKDTISTRFKDKEILMIGGVPVATFKSQTRLTLDVKKINDLYPEVAKECTTTKIMRVLRVKTKK